MKHIARYCSAVLFAAGVLPAAAAPADVQRERERILVAQQHAHISSASRLMAYLDAMPGDSPFLTLSGPALDRFVASLAFNENGLTTYSTADIERELSYSQAYRLLSLFGAQRTLTHLPGLRIDNGADEHIP